MEHEGTKKRVRLVLEVDFGGEYYEAGELVPVLDDWVGAGTHLVDLVRAETGHRCGGTAS